MRNLLSFNGANFVAREIGYHMPDGWGQGDSATQDAFRPIENFEERFDSIVGEIAALGFEALDLWTAHLHYLWATPEHIAAARRTLAKHNLQIVSYAGGFGGSLEEFRSACRLCAELNIPIAGGGTDLLENCRSDVVSALREFGIVFAYENHPEKSIEEILGKLGDGGEDVIGVALDTGWLATQNVDVVPALRAVAPRLKHLHLKDVKARRAEETGYMLIDMGHETCRLGDGIVPVEECARMLPEIGYTGAISIEHEPEEFDPRQDVKESATLVRSWLAGGGHRGH